jgi:hypothetical protein
VAIKVSAGNQRAFPPFKKSSSIVPVVAVSRLTLKFRFPSIKPTFLEANGERDLGEDSRNPAVQSTQDDEDGIWI